MASPARRRRRSAASGAPDAKRFEGFEGVEGWALLSQASLSWAFLVFHVPVSMCDVSVVWMPVWSERWANVPRSAHTKRDCLMVAARSVWFLEAALFNESLG